MVTTTGMMLAQQTTKLVEMVKEMEGQVALITPGTVSLSAGMIAWLWTHSQLTQQLTNT